MNTNHRPNSYLEERLQYIWNNHFPDIPRVNQIIIQFGRSARNQLGSIRAIGPRRVLRRPGPFPKHSWWLPESTSIITINGHFKKPAVPGIIIDSVIAHELVHYAHGFSSPHPQLFRYPHQGGIVTRELKKRGLSEALKFQKQWLKTTWKNEYRNNK